MSQTDLAFFSPGPQHNDLVSVSHNHSNPKYRPGLSPLMPVAFGLRYAGYWNATYSIIAVYTVAYTL